MHPARRLQQLRFVKSESTFSYFEALELYLAAHGCPVAFYSDKHTVFRVAKAEARAGRGMTQFRPSSGGAEHRDPVRQFQSGQRPRGARQSHAPGPACEGTAPRGRIRHRDGQRLPAGVHDELQPEVRQGPCPA